MVKTEKHGAIIFFFNLSLSSLNVIIEVFTHVTDTPTTARKKKKKKGMMSQM